MCDSEPGCGGCSGVQCEQECIPAVSVTINATCNFLGVDEYGNLIYEIVADGIITGPDGVGFDAAPNFLFNEDGTLDGYQIDPFKIVTCSGWSDGLPTFSCKRLPGDAPTTYWTGHWGKFVNVHNMSVGGYVYDGLNTQLLNKTEIIIGCPIP